MRVSHMQQSLKRFLKVLINADLPKNQHSCVNFAKIRKMA